MKYKYQLILAGLLGFSIIAFARSPFKQSQQEDKPKKIPVKWYQKAKGYQKALTLQKETGADIFIYFTVQAPPNQKGLCTWWERKGARNMKVKKYLRNYIKVQVPLPSNPDSQKLAKQFKVKRCPAVFVVQTNGWQQYIKVFNWDTGKPKLREPEELIELIRARSSDHYALPPEEEKEK